MKAGNVPVMGATVCAIGTGGRCAQNVTDQSGYYTIEQLPDGAYQMLARNYGLLEPVIRSGTVDGQRRRDRREHRFHADRRRQRHLRGQRRDAGSDSAQPARRAFPDDASQAQPGGESRLPRPGGYRLVPVHRDGGKEVHDHDFGRRRDLGHLRRTTGPSTTVSTKLYDQLATIQLFQSSGWVAPTTGERLVGLSSAFSSSYTITLTEGTTGPPAPTISARSTRPRARRPAERRSRSTGTNFVAGTTVKFGTQNATNVVIVNATTITCKSPALATGGTLYRRRGNDARRRRSWSARSRRMRRTPPRHS